MTCHYTDLSGASDYPRGPTNQKHYTDKSRDDASSVWNFCARSSDVIRGETSGGVAKCRLFSKVTTWREINSLVNLAG